MTALPKNQKMADFLKTLKQKKEVSALGSGPALRGLQGRCDADLLHVTP